MSVKNNKLIFELSAKEKEDKLKPFLSEAIQKAVSLNLPKVYKNEICIKPNLFIHKYPNGAKFLIEQDPRNSIEKTVKALD